MDILAQHNRSKVVDLLMERLTFERASVKLYDRVLERMIDSDNPEVQRMLQAMREHREEEKEHEEWLEAQLRALDANPHGESELSRLIETESMGIEEVVLHSGAQLPHLLHAMLAAELVDNAGWELLVQLADEAGDKAAKKGFKKRLHEEEKHLLFLRKVMERLNLREVLGEKVHLPSTP